MLKTIGKLLFFKYIEWWLFILPIISSVYMKRFLFIPVLLASLVLASFAFGADSVINFLDDLWQDTLFGYSTDKKIEVKSISTSKVVITSDVILDDFDDEIVNYTAIYSKYPLSELLDNTSLLSESMEKSFSNLDLDWEDSFDMEFALSDWITASNVYYISIIPKDENEFLWQVSNEICFKLSTQTYWEGDECENWTAWHGAWADMTLANITHTINGNRITLRWTAVDWSDSVDVFLWNDWEGSFNKLWSPDMDSETYTFTVSKNGEYIVKFIPDNWWRETTYTINVTGISTTSTTPTNTPTAQVTTVPKVWPTQNIILILVLSFVGYLLYRNLLKRKH